MLGVILLSVIILCVVMLNGSLLGVGRPNVILVGVIVLSVMANKPWIARPPNRKRVCLV